MAPVGFLETLGKGEENGQVEAGCWHPAMRWQREREREEFLILTGTHHTPRSSQFPSFFLFFFFFFIYFFFGDSVVGRMLRIFFLSS
jgi:hypothetical protein